nr:NADH dehydrogenase subunit 3 [Propeamussium sp. mt1]
MDCLWLIVGMCSLVPLFFVFWSFCMTKLWYADSQKISPYECGFDPFGETRSPISLRFYTIAILFLVFEVESVLFFPVLGSWLSGVGMFWIGSIGFLFILLLGLFYEMVSGALQWVKD